MDPRDHRNTVGPWKGRRGVKPPNAGQKYPPEPLSQQEVLRLIGGCGRGPCGDRNRALIVILWRAGLRVNEALALRPKDIDHQLGAVTVLHGKGDNRRMVGLDPMALAIVNDWLDVRAALGINGRHPLFCKVDVRYRGGPVRDAYVRDMVKRAARNAGIEKRVHPHGLRHTHAFELANEDVPIHVIRKQLGHSSLSVTERYVNHLAPIAVVRAMQARSWPDAAATPGKPAL